MTKSYNAYFKVIKSIKRELTSSEIFLTNNIKYEYLFTIKKYNQSIVYLNAAISTIEKDVFNDIRIFWLYLNLIWFAFEASCLANKKNISKEYIKKAIAYSKSDLVQSDSNYLFEINKFILKMKIQNMLYVEEFSMLHDYSVMLFEIMEKKSSQREFYINSLLQSKIQLSICYIINRDIKKSYDLIQDIATDDKFTQNHDYKMCYYIIKIHYEIHQKQYDLCHYSIHNLYRYIKTNSINKELDTTIYKKLQQYFKTITQQKAKLKAIQQIERVDSLMYSMIPLSM